MPPNAAHHWPATASDAPPLTLRCMRLVRRQAFLAAWLRFAIDQNKGDSRCLLRPIGPRVIGTSLNEHISSPHQGFALVHHGVDLPFEHDGVIHRFGAMHPGMFSVLFVVLCVLIHVPESGMNDSP